MRGVWTGNGGQKIAGVVFITPQTGTYRVTATARSKPWEGGAQSFKLGVFKKDTQRAPLEKFFDLPRSGDAVKIDFTIELTAGHELAFIPLMPDWHNATTTSIDELTITEVK